MKMISVKIYSSFFSLVILSIGCNCKNGKEQRAFAEKAEINSVFAKFLNADTVRMYSGDKFYEIEVYTTTDSCATIRNSGMCDYLCFYVSRTDEDTLYKNRRNPSQFIFDDGKTCVSSLRIKKNKNEKGIRIYFSPFAFKNLGNRTHLFSDLRNKNGREFYFEIDEWDVKTFIHPVVNNLKLVSKITQNRQTDTLEFCSVEYQLRIFEKTDILTYDDLPDYKYHKDPKRWACVEISGKNISQLPWVINKNFARPEDHLFLKMGKEKSFIYSEFKKYNSDSSGLQFLFPIERIKEFNNEIDIFMGYTVAGHYFAPAAGNACFHQVNIVERMEPLDTVLYDKNAPIGESSFFYSLQY